MKFSFCKKQYLYMGLAAFALSLALVSHVSAQEEVPNEAGDSTERAVLSPRMQDRIINLSRNMSDRMTAAISRFEQIIIRMESRIEKLAAEGKGNAQAAEMLDRARAELSEAKGELDVVGESLERVVTSDNPLRGWQDIRASFLVAAHSIRDTKTHLQTTLDLLKGVPSETDEDTAVSEDLNVQSQ